MARAKRDKPKASLSPAEARERAARRLRFCAWLGVAGLLAGAPLVYAMAHDGIDQTAAMGIAAWAMIAAITGLCFHACRTLRQGHVPNLLLLGVPPALALVFPGLPILLLTPWAVVIGIGRFFKTFDPRELAFLLWGLFGIAFFVAMVVIVVTAFKLRQNSS